MILPTAVEVEVQRDLVDWILAVSNIVIAVTAVAAVGFSWRALQKTRREISLWRGELEPSDRLLQTRHNSTVVAELQERFHFATVVDSNSSTAWDRWMETAQQRLVLLPRDELPKLRSMVDAYPGMYEPRGLHLKQSSQVREDDIRKELATYKAKLVAQLAELENNPLAVNGIIQAV